MKSFNGKEHKRTHGGEITVKSSPGQGTEFRIIQKD